MTTILFQGDSITDGNRGRNGDPNHDLGHGYVFMIAAELGLASPHEHVIINRGISGNRIDHLYGRWEEDALMHAPDWISLLVGVNDIEAMVTNAHVRYVDRFERSYRRIIEDTLEFQPGCRFILGEPFLLPVGRVGAHYSAYSSIAHNIRQTVRTIAESYHMPFVPLQDRFEEACAKAAPPSYWLWDGIHPTPAGHALIRDRWLQVFRSENK
ncbi:lysophospholipase [Paenibacillus nanensis]|uniref:Lysophospholipase n=1 Tax=Paenibacillus nanensis TaxID=393251 RepID=A0A3A1VLV7_9BACL|nr:GDSL-type esterase/lipase family protein [Paenibacillus nanensis]RIX59493.1 lysophospholipase [Paenibacillus nanensis]